ncbi:hypothetical protein J2W89_003793 [Pseudarthrobacter oxydans]|uniref:hypothetical protein n=1 Tax=Pseudarthrobacter oxydans TaxID=1671 RepID=UPI00285A9125|nr:hypothetical protein [Pseudarthrobacter oxydans]MDR6794611.1 hypothetical protein [Pseudarthrobacter oxydans]
MQDKEPGIHFGWVGLLAAIGVVVTYLAFWGPFIPSLGDNAVAVWQSIFTNFGVGVFSAAVLLLFEPKLRKVITKTVTEEVRDAVQVDLEARLAPLSDRINSLYEAKLAGQQALVTDLAKNFTNERVTQVLREADAMAALYAKSLRVQAEDVPGKLHIGLELRSFYGADAWRNGQPRPGEQPEEELVLSAYTTSKNDASVTWESDEDFATVAFDLAEELASQGARGLKQQIIWDPVLERFERNFKIALEASNGGDGVLGIDGALVEVAGSDSAPWYLTNEGLYYPNQSWSLPAKSFVIPHRGHGYETRSFPDVDKPSWADPAEWDYMVSRARSHFDIF